MKKAFLFILFGLVTVLSSAQDYHYWSEQFGTRASFLGGAATAGLNDNSDVYYNPAAMAYIEKPSLSISVNAYRFSTIYLNNVLGDGLSVKGHSLNILPNMIAGVLPLKKHPKLRLGYAVITKRFYENKFNYFHAHFADIIKSEPGNEIFLGSYYYYHAVKEYWGGIAASYKINEHIALGLSHYGAYRNVKYTNQYDLDVLPSDGGAGEISSVTSTIIFDYWNVKILFKPSISFHYDKFRMGITYTTPTMNIVGRGNVYRDFSVVNLSEVISSDIAVLDRQNKIKTTHKDGGSLAVGLSFKLNKNNWLHFSNETFFAAKEYYIFEHETSPNVFPTSITEDEVINFFGQQRFLSLKEKSKLVSNFGLGLESKVSDKLSMLFGARTDFLHNADPNFQFDRLQVSSSKWDLFHISIGAETFIKNKRYMAGIEFGFAGNPKFKQAANFENVQDETNIFGTDNGSARAQVYSFKFLMEISLGTVK